MRQTIAGGWRNFATLLVLGVVLATPLAAADGPGESENTPAYDNTPTTTPPGDPSGATMQADTTDAGPPGQGCRPMCFDAQA